MVEYEFYGEILDHSQYEQLREDLRNATENDTIILRINSCGGDVDIGWMIVKAIQESKAFVTARVVFPSASMAAIVACACDYLVMDEFCELMFHSYSAGFGGKAHEMLGQLSSGHKHLTGMFNKVIGKFLTKTEIRRMWNGEDIRIAWDTEDFEDRRDRHFTRKKEFLNE